MNTHVGERGRRESRRWTASPRDGRRELRDDRHDQHLDRPRGEGRGAVEDRSHLPDQGPGAAAAGRGYAAIQMRAKGRQAIPSYQLLADADLKDREAVKTKLRAAGVDGVLVMR